MIISIIQRNEVKATDYNINSALRKKMRTEKQEKASQLNDGKLHHVNYPLLKPSAEEVQWAYEARRHHSAPYERSEAVKLSAIASSSIFSADRSESSNNRIAGGSLTISSSGSSGGVSDRKRMLLAREGFTMNVTPTAASSSANKRKYS